MKIINIHAGRADDTAFELYLDFIRSTSKLHEIKKGLQEYAILTQNTYGSKFDFII